MYAVEFNGQPLDWPYVPTQGKYEPTPDLIFDNAIGSPCFTGRSKSLELAQRQEGADWLYGRSLSVLIHDCHLAPFQSGKDRTLTTSLVNETLFFDLTRSRRVIADWIEDYISSRSHSALN